MKARLIAVGERAPGWVADGFGEYRKRLSHWLPLELVEIEPGLRGKGRELSFSNPHVRHCNRILTDWSVGTGYNIAPKPVTKTAKDKAVANLLGSGVDSILYASPAPAAMHRSRRLDASRHAYMRMLRVVK